MDRRRSVSRPWKDDTISHVSLKMSEIHEVSHLQPSDGVTLTEI
jgi:hypothetical protein